MRAHATFNQLVAVFLFAVFTAGGCALAAREKQVDVLSDVLSNYLADKPAPLQPHYTTLLRQGPRNEVLNQMRVGVGAMDVGPALLATESFDRAVTGIEVVYANSPEAAKAREKFTRESYKDFKGEPYERAMAYYYRGLLYLSEGDYENARATFKGGMLQDAFAEEEQNRSDFALLAFLEGWASWCRDDTSLAEQSFAEVRRLKSGVATPAAGHNVLFLAELGWAPIKYADGKHKSQLRYRRGDEMPETKAVWHLGAERYETVEIEDVYWQAATRGGRPVDYILEGKVQFKEGAQTTGTVLKTVGYAALVSGAGLNSQAGGYVGLAGAALTLAGLVADGVAAATQPEADVRYWDNLPDTVHLATAAGTPGVLAYDVQFLDASDQVVAGLGRTGEVRFAGKCGLGWARSRSGVPADAQAPGSVTK